MIISFYSFKGGVGRTMALVNIGVELALAGKSVLMVDLDLEAPGLTTYMRDLSSSPISNQPGIIEWLSETATAGSGLKSSWRDYVSRVDTKLDTHVNVMTSGRWDSSYNSRVLGFEWGDFFERGGGDILESLRTEWNDSYDIVLVDSRTGITDTAGVCTVHLPDVIVPVFTANEQSVEGVSDVIRRAQDARTALAHPRGKALIFPLASRFDDRTESELSREWMQRFARALGDFYDDWLPTSVTAKQALERTKLPYVSFYSFGDSLAVLRDSPSDVTSLGFAFRTAARLIHQDFRDVERLFQGEQFSDADDNDPVSAYSVMIAEAPEPSATELQNFMARIVSYALRSEGPVGGPPAESIDAGVQKMLIRAGIVIRREDRVVLRDRDQWAGQPAHIHKYLYDNSELLTWSHRVTEAVEDRIQHVLEGEDLAQGLAYSMESPELLTPYELELVQSSERWAMPSSRRYRYSTVLRGYVVFILSTLLGLGVGALINTIYYTPVTAVAGAAAGVFLGISLMAWTLNASRQLGFLEETLDIDGAGSALRVASLVLQPYGYTGRRSGPVAILTVQDLSRIPAAYIGLPGLRAKVPPEMLAVHLRVRGRDSMTIQGPQFAVAKVAAKLRGRH
jgi:cellulose biosynthesis protein BcsQ